MQSESFVAEIIADGRVTIPETIRQLFNLKKGDLVRISVKPVKPGESLEKKTRN